MIIKRPFPPTARPPVAHPAPREATSQPLAARAEPQAQAAQRRLVQTAGLVLLTTKDGRLEDAAAIKARIHEAATYVPLERLALSPQCGFASVEAGNPLTAEEQAAKLRLVAQVVQRVWGVEGRSSAVARGRSSAG
jgi:hypothetical protein